MAGPLSPRCVNRMFSRNDTAQTRRRFQRHPAQFPQRLALVSAEHQRNQPGPYLHVCARRIAGRRCNRNRWRRSSESTSPPVAITSESQIEVAKIGRKIKKVPFFRMRSRTVVMDLYPALRTFLHQHVDDLL